MSLPTHNLLLGIILGILILVSLISYFQGYVISSSRIFMCLFYCSLLITFYFTYSKKVAKKMIKKQIHLAVQDINIIQENLQIQKKQLPENLESANDIKNKKNNKIIWHRSKILIGICLIMSFILSVGIWIYNNKHHKYFNLKKYSKEIIFKNLFILLAVLLVQFLFSTIFIGNILPLNSKEIIKTVIQNYLNS